MSLVCYAPRRTFAPWTQWEASLNQARSWAPAVDIREDANAYTFEIDLPGVSKENVHIEAEGNTLTIKGERKPVETQPESVSHRVERRAGDFVRAFEIPEGFDADKIAAHLDNGVLRVTLPKREELKPKHIQVTVN